MSWTLTQTYTKPDDLDAITYINAVEAADGEPLETIVKIAINRFVKGCKADGIWNAIKASCIMAGARTLDGALVPLKGTAPTNYNFVSGDYDRKTGLKGDGSTKYLDSNRNNNADPQDSKHLAGYRTESETRDATRALMGFGANSAPGQTQLLTVASNTIYYRINTASTGSDTASGPPAALGLFSASRSSTVEVIGRYSGAVVSLPQESSPPLSANILVFSRGSGGSPSGLSNARLSFYSIGEAVDLALLDARVSTLMSTFTSAIP